MVTTGKINLIKEFSENQKENDIIILTTFKFDAPFFDIYLINRILDYNPSAEIFVLMDGNEYIQGYDSFTKHTGRAYHLIPVFSNKGVFHPKLSLFYSGTESKITAYIGSCNITLAGFTANAEIITKIESTLNPVDSTAEDALGYYYDLIQKKHIINKKFSEAIEEIKNTLKNPKTNDKVYLIHNLEKPILNQVLEQTTPAEEVTMLAPFWSPSPILLQEIHKNKSVKKVNLLIQEKNHNLTNPEKYKEYCEKEKIQLTFYKAKFEKSRRFHSKILLLKSSNHAALFGSSNMTESALLRNVNSGNFEVSALIKGEVEKIVKEVKTEEIKDINTIKSQSIEYKKIQSPDIIKILSIDFDMITQNLTITIEKNSTETTIKIIFEDKSEEIQIIKDQEEVSIHCDKIPFELVFTQGTKTARRRIFYDSNYIYKRISKGNISLTEINRKIARDYKINAMDLLRVLSGINITIEKERKIEKKTEVKREGERKKFSLPSREIDSYHNKRIINNFVDLYKLMNSKKEEEREVQRAGEIDESAQPKILSKAQRILDEDEEKRKICLKILDSINDLLIFKASLNENPELEIVASTPLMIQSIIKILSPIYMDNELLETFKSYVNENLSKVNMSSIDIELRKNLFNHLVLINYYFNNWTHYNFISEILNVREVMTPDFIKECLEQVKGHISELRPEECDENEIIQHAGYLSSYIPDSAMEEDIIISLKLIQKFSKKTELELAKTYLENIISIWSISEDLKGQIYECIKGYSKEMKEYIKELLKDK